MDIYDWTRHAEWKMREYGLSEQRVKRVIRHPDRVEKSIVPKMVAAMQVAGTSKNRYEIWVMYCIKTQSSKFKGQNENYKVQNEEAMQNEGEMRNAEFRMWNEMRNAVRKNSSFKIHNSSFQNMSPAARFRMERRKDLEVKMNIVGAGGKTIRVISAWRYPGKSPERDPIPSEILEEIRGLVSTDY